MGIPFTIQLVLPWTKNMMWYLCHNSKRFVFCHQSTFSFWSGHWTCVQCIWVWGYGDGGSWYIGIFYHIHTPKIKYLHFSILLCASSATALKRFPNLVSNVILCACVHHIIVIHTLCFFVLWWTWNVIHLHWNWEQDVFAHTRQNVCCHPQTHKCIWVSSRSWHKSLDKTFLYLIFDMALVFVTIFSYHVHIHTQVEVWQCLHK